MVFESLDFLGIEGEIADAQARQDISDLKSALNSMTTATESDQGKALKAKTVSNGKVTEWEFGEAGSSGISAELKSALLQIAAKIAYVDENGQNYYNDLYNALNPSASLASISAVYTQSGLVFDTDSLDSLKPDLVVTAHYDDQSTSIVTMYTLSGTLAEGPSTITVNYGGKTTTFTVTVTEDVPTGYTKYDYIALTSAPGQTETGGMIDTGLDGNYSSPMYNHEISFILLASPYSNSNAIYGQRGTTGSEGAKSGRSIWIVNANKNLAANYAGVDTGFIASVSTNAKHTSVTKNGTWYVDDDVVAENLSDTWTAYEYNNIQLFGIATSSSGFGPTRSIIGIYGFSVFDSVAGEYIAYMVPCTDSNSVPGFYDVVRKAFYTSSNPTTMLTAANDE